MAIAPTLLFCPGLGFLLRRRFGHQFPMFVWLWGPGREFYVSVGTGVSPQRAPNNGQKAILQPVHSIGMAHIDGEDIILVRRETSPEDVDGMHHAKGILTSTGGMTSHAAVVARGWGKCCVVGAGDLRINAKEKKVIIDGKSFGAEDIFSIDYISKLWGTAKHDPWPAQVTLS